MSAPQGIQLNPTSWTPIGPAPLSITVPPNANFNVSGRIAAVAAHPTDPSTIYVAPAGGGVWKTTTGGTSWSPLTDTQVTLSMGALAIGISNPSVVYAGTGEANNSGDSNYGRGILVSTDGGTTWTLSTGPAGMFNTNRLTTSQIAVDPTNASVAYAAMADFGANGIVAPSSTGIYKTSDGGTTWTNTTTMIESLQPWSAVALDPNNPQTVYAAVGRSAGAGTNGVYKSTDGGASWSLLANAPKGSSTGRFAIAVSKSASSVVYVSVSNPAGAVLAVKRSDDAGATFATVTPPSDYMRPQGGYDQTIIIDPSNSAVVYVAGAAANSILRSVDSGVSWTDISTGGAPNFTSPHVDHHGAAFDANGKLLDGDDGGIYRLDDPTVPSWSDLNGNLQTIQFQGVGLHPTDSNQVIGGSQDNGTEVFAGSTIWTRTDGGDGGFAKFSPTNGSRAYHQIPVPSFGSNFFRRSDDGGHTWTTRITGIAVTDPQKFYAPFAVDPGNGDRVLYGTNNVWETTNGGDDWTALSSVGMAGWTPPAGSSVDAIGLAASDVNTIYAAASGHVFVTSNHGATWAEVSITSCLLHVADLQVDPASATTVYAVINRFTNGFAGCGTVFRTTTGGTAWTDISGGLPNEPVWSLQIDPNGTLYVGADDGVYASANGGTNWSRFGTGFPNAQVFQIALSTGLHLLAAATHGRGMWEILTSTAAVTLSSATFDFGGVNVGDSKVASPPITLTNSGTAPLTITNVTLTGADAGQYGQTNTCPLSPATLAAGGSCTVTPKFQPTSTGAKNNAALSIADTASGSPQTIALTGTGADFALSVPTSSQTVTAGSPASYTVSLTTSGAATVNTITFTASGLPLAATSSFSPGSIPAGNAIGSSTFTFTVTTTRSSIVTPIRAPLTRQPGALPWLFAVLLALASLVLRRCALRAHGLAPYRMVVLLLSLAILAGCGAGGGTPGGAAPGTPPGTYTITITATSGSVTHFTQVTLIVQ